MATDTVAHNAVTLRDSRGKTGRSTFYVIYDPAVAQDGHDVAAAMNAAIEALSNGAVASEVGLAGHKPAGLAYGADAVYETAEDAASFTFINADGTLHRFSVPAPKAAIFLADGDTVDPANGLVTALRTAVVNPLATANVADANGRGFIAYVGGSRVRRRLQRKQTIYWKNPQETTPDE